ncbi:MAG: ABC transporter permease [Clostridia bacterium]|nr:ABC transporter permease [Clostridia bacterium]
MIELLKFEFYRLYKSKLSWILVGVMALLPILAVIALTLIYVYATRGEEGKIEPELSRFLTWVFVSYFYKWVPMVLALFIPLFVGRDYRDGFIRNKLTGGHTRFQIFTSAIISKAAYAVALCVAYIGAGLIASAISPFGVDLNDGEMILRLLSLILSIVATSVLFTVLALIIKNRAVPVILSVVFVMSFSLAGTLATTFAYDHRMIDDYERVREKKIEKMGYDSDEFEVDKEKYFNFGWYVGHPVFLLTNAGMQNEFIPGTGAVLSLTLDSLSYKDEIARHPFNSLITLVTQDMTFLEDKDLHKIDGAFVPVETAELQYNIKSIVWTTVYFGAGYALFRKKNVF